MDLTAVLQNGLLFYLYAFAGWCTEVAYAAFKEKRFVNRGFLNGPVCPIYGFGVVGVMLLMSSLKASLPETDNIGLLFLFSCVLTTLIELVTGFLLEKIFHTRWWDYSHLKWNIGGYICPQFSLIWGAACVVVVKVIQPNVDIGVSWVPFWALVTLDSIFTVCILVDVAATVAAIHKMNDHLQRLSAVAQDMHAFSNDLGERIYEGTMAVTDRAEKGEKMLSAGKEKLAQAKAATEERIDQSKQSVQQRIDTGKRQMEERRQRFTDLLQERHFGERRLMRAFPRMRHVSYPEALNALRESYAKLRQGRDNT